MTDLLTGRWDGVEMTRDHMIHWEDFKDVFIMTSAVTGDGVEDDCMLFTCCHSDDYHSNKYHFMISHGDDQNIATPTNILLEDIIREKFILIIQQLY